MPHQPAKPWPIQQMIEWYSSGNTLQEIADMLSSHEWQPYWVSQTGQEYQPHQKIVNKVLKKHIQLRGRGAPGERNRSWNGGRRVDRDGYILVYMPHHPQAMKNGCVREHRLIVERHIGRLLKASEVVHHKDDDPSNNDPSNLMVYETNAVHISETRKGRASKGQQRGIRRAGLARWGRLDPEIDYPGWLLTGLYKDRLTVTQIAGLLDCDRRTVSNHLNRLGWGYRYNRPGVVTDEHRELCRQFLATARQRESDAQASQQF